MNFIQFFFFSISTDVNNFFLFLRYLGQKETAGFYRKDHLRKHIKSHQTKRAKEAANAATTSNQQSDSTGEAITTIIKREKPSPDGSPHHRENHDEVSTSAAVTIPQFTLPQEVTIHVSV